LINVDTNFNSLFSNKKKNPTLKVKSSIIIIMPPPPPPPPGPPGPPPPPQPSVSASAPATGERNALLKSIEKGARLKKAVTNDRSAPVFEGMYALTAKHNDWEYIRY
jgi:hypothetical protein